MASTYLNKTFSTNGTSDKITTISFWCKRATTGTENSIITAGASLRDLIRFETSGALRIRLSNGSADLITNRLFRDTNAFYNIVISFKTDEGTSSNRIKLYVNGVQETSFSTSTYPAQNTTLKIGTANSNHIGNDSEQTNPYYDGLITHFHLIDGTAYDASTFGETDSTSGIWKPKTEPSVTYGTNGFFLKMENSGAMGTDSSGNGNNFTVNGTLTQNVDTPSNNFATLSPLYNQTGGQGVVLANGNTRCSYSPNSSRSAFGTIAVGTGKYYYEAKLNTGGTGAVVGVVDLAWPEINGASGYAFHDYAINFGYDLSGQKTSGGSATAFGSALNNNDIVQVAMDLDNSKLYFGVNGTWQNSGDPTSGASGTGSAFNLASDTLYTSACRIRNGGDWSFNFGQGYFGTTAVASAGTSPSGGGIFEFDCPSGYQSLSTKGINSF